MNLIVPRSLISLVRVPPTPRLIIIPGTRWHSRRWNATASLGTDQHRSIPSRTHEKLQHIVPRITDKQEAALANKYISLLAQFDSGIYQDQQTCSQLRDILFQYRSRSELFKEIIRISRFRLLQILFTNHFFQETFYLLDKERSTTTSAHSIKYQPQIPPSIVAATLVHLNKRTDLTKYMRWVLEDDNVDVHTRGKFVRSIVKNYMHLNKIGMAIKWWHDYCFLAYGQLNFDNNVRFPDCTISLYLILNQFPTPAALKTFLVQFQELNGLSNHHFSLLLSSCIYVLGNRTDKLDHVMALWELKTLQNMELHPEDLTSAMSILNRNKVNDQALKLYQDHPLLHEDAQFDTLLRIHGSAHQWRSMQEQFEQLFGRGELPNLTHYAIVMTALASRGETKAVMMLWDQLLSRKMIPNIPVVHLLMLTSMKTKDFRNTILWFQKMPSYGLAYTAQSYNYLFQLLRGLKELQVQLKFFKRLVFEEKFALNHQTFNEILMTCMELNDHVTAEYVYRTLQDFGYQLGDSMDAIMLNIYSNNGKFVKVDRKITELAALGPPSTKIYNQMMVRYVKEERYNDVFELVSKMRSQNILLDGHSYSQLLTLLIKSENISQSMRIFNDLKPHFSVKQFNRLMRTLYDSPHYKKITDVYDNMIELDLNPDLESYQYLVQGLCKQYSLEKADPELTIELAVKIVNTLLMDKSKGSLQAKDINLPFTLVYQLLTVLLDYDFALCKSLFVDFYESCEDKLTLEKDIRFSYISLQIHQKEANFKEFKPLFDTYINTLHQKFLVTPKTEQVSKKTTPDYLRYGLSNFWPTYLRICTKNNELSKVQEFMAQLVAKGFIFTNKNYNQTLIALLRSEDTLESGLQLIEDKLMHGFIYLRRKRKFRRVLLRAGKKLDSQVYPLDLFKDKFKFYLEGLSYMKMVQILSRRILPRFEDRKLKLQELRSKFPKSLRFYDYRVRVVDMWWLTYLKYSKMKVKKIKFACEHEGNMYRMNQRIARKVAIAEKRRIASIKRLSIKRKFRKGERFGFKPRGRLQEFEQRPEKRPEGAGSDARSRPSETGGAVQSPKKVPSPFVSRIGSLIGDMNK